jgi:hypothetical protein
VIPFEALLAEASEDENLVGVVLFGSRGKGIRHGAERLGRLRRRP